MSCLGLVSIRFSSIWWLSSQAVIYVRGLALDYLTKSLAELRLEDDRYCILVS